MQEERSKISWGGRHVLAAMVCAMAACAADPGGTGGPILDQPDAAMPHPPRNRCQAGDPPCEADTECVDFGNYGGQVCAQFCTQSQDCETGLVCVPDQNGKGVCATAEWGGVAGILPEELCDDENACNVQWDDNVNGCRAYFNACLGGLSNQQLQEWTSYVNSCLTNANGSCSNAFNCLAGRAWC